MCTFLILGAAIIVTSLFALFSVISFVSLPEGNGLDVECRR
jgi:hypothetical protein